jgi:hypothetical protein
MVVSTGSIVPRREDCIYSQAVAKTVGTTVDTTVADGQLPTSTRYDATCSHRLKLSLTLSYTQCHDRIDNVISILLQCFDRFLPRHICLSHYKFNVLALQPGVINLLIIIIILFWLFDFFLALSVIVVVTSMIMTCMVARIGALSGSQLLGSVGLCLRVQVFDLGFTKDAEVSLAKPS